MNKFRNLEMFLPDRLDGLARSVCRRIGNVFEQEFGISIPEWRVIVTLGHYPGLAAVDVAERTVLDKVAVSRAVCSLVDRGIVARQPAEADRRRSELNLTANGEVLRTSLESRALRMEAELLDGLSKSELDELFRLLDRLDARSENLARAT